MLELFEQAILSGLTHMVESRVAKCGRPGIKEIMRDEA